MYVCCVLTDKLNPFEVAVHQLSKVEKLMDPFSSLCFNDSCHYKTNADCCF